MFPSGSIIPKRLRSNYLSSFLVFTEDCLMKVLNVDVHNVMAVKDVRLDLSGHHLFLIGGKNGQGKSSTLTALLMALCGKRDLDSYPEIALREGEDKGWVKVDLSGDDELHDAKGFSVELLLSRKRSGQVVEEFRVIDSAGDEAPEPRTLLKRLYDLKAFDPLALERLDRKGKKEIVQKALGLDFTASDQLHKKKFDERAAVNKQIKSLEAKYDKMPKFTGVPKAEVSVADLLAEEEKLKAVNTANQAERAKLQGINRETLQAEQACATADQKVRHLEEQLENARRDLVSARNSMMAARETKQAQAEVVAKLVDQNTAPIRQQIADSGEINRKIRANLDRETTGSELDSLEAQKNAIEKDMEDIKDAQQKALLAAPWPVEGMSLDEEGLLYNGLPFEQASKALRTRVSVKIGMALNPKLRLLVCQAGGDCDEDTLAELEQVLEDNDFQMLLELVTRGAEDEARCAVIMRAGEVVDNSADGELNSKAA
jgi:ABC-type dipeptide/oligopeptide/nickel transport system ATPase component